MQTLTWLPECLNERKDESHLVMGNYPYIFFNYYKTHTHISFSVILAGILRAGKKHFLGNLAVRFVYRMRSANRRIAHALSESLYFFAGKHQLPSQTGPLPPGLSHPFLGMGPGPLQLGKITSF